MAGIAGIIITVHGVEEEAGLVVVRMGLGAGDETDLSVP